MKVIIVVSIVLVLCGNVVAEREVISVGDIKYHCGEDGKIVKIRTNTTKLKLPENCQALYSVNTERRKICTNQQRCTLMTWKIVRDLEMFLNNNYNNTGSEGIVEFENKMIIPEFNYLLHVTLKDFKGHISEKDIQITFSERNNDNSPKDILGNLNLIIGTDFIYSSLPLIVNADLKLCGNITHYFFKWSLITLSQRIVFPEKSSKLNIALDRFKIKNDESCTITCTVINTENNSSILEGSNVINIKDPPIEYRDNIDVSLPFTYITVNRGSPIYIEPYIHIPLVSDLEYKIEWSCIRENVWLKGCQGQMNKDFYMESGFSDEGNYSITLKVSKGDLQKSVSCYVIVTSDVPSIELDTEQPLRPERGIEITAKIYQLRTYCTVQWSSDELDDIPGFNNEVYNVSSKDKTFLGEMVDFGDMTVAKSFKLYIPPPSREWRGLDSKTYNLKMMVTCPTLPEINDMTVIKEFPEEFVTVSARTEFIVTSAPHLESLAVFCEDDKNEAIQSSYVFKVDGTGNSPMVYKYGFLLENKEILFYSGIDTLSAKTILPFNSDDGIDTFVEVCNYESSCGRTFGPVIVTRQTSELEDNNILGAFKQMLIEENYYKAFSYSFMVLHSVKFLESANKYRDLFSVEIFNILDTLVRQDEKTEKNVVNEFVKNLVMFLDHLYLSEDVMKQLSILTRRFSSGVSTRIRVERDTSGILLNRAAENVAKLEEIKNYLAASEYVMLNTLNTEAEFKEREHFLSLLDSWMVLACNMLFNGQRIRKLEMTSVILSIEKITKTLLRNLITIPFDDNIWNNSAKVRIKDITNFTANKLCLGKTMLKNFFNKSALSFGVNIYKGYENPTEVTALTDIEIFLPLEVKISKIKQPKCVVHKNGVSLYCSIAKQFRDFVQCSCQIFGYYFIEYVDLHSEKQSRDLIISNNMSSGSFNNSGDYKTEDEYYGNVQLGQKISYVIIISSLVGFLILCYIIRKLTIYPQQNIGLDGFHDNVQYGHVMHDDLLD